MRPDGWCVAASIRNEWFFFRNRLALVSDKGLPGFNSEDTLSNGSHIAKGSFNDTFSKRSLGLDLY